MSFTEKSKPTSPKIARFGIARFGVARFSQTQGWSINSKPAESTMSEQSKPAVAGFTIKAKP